MALRDAGDELNVREVFKRIEAVLQALRYRECFCSAHCIIGGASQLYTVKDKELNN